MLRVIAPDRTLISAPLSYFDAKRMAKADVGWRKIARVIGQTMSGHGNATIVNHRDVFLAARIHDLMRMGYSEVRLPRA